MPIIQKCTCELIKLRQQHQLVMNRWFSPSSCIIHGDHIFLMMMILKLLNTLFTNNQFFIMTHITSMKPKWVSPHTSCRCWIYMKMNINQRLSFDLIRILRPICFEKIFLFLFFLFLFTITKLSHYFRYVVYFERSAQEINKTKKKFTVLCTNS